MQRQYWRTMVPRATDQLQDNGWILPISDGMRRSDEIGVVAKIPNVGSIAGAGQENDDLATRTSKARPRRGVGSAPVLCEARREHSG